VIEMPRSFSMAIQSEVTPRRPALPCTAPAWLIADACSARASVSVDLPASGWLMTANVRRRPASALTPRATPTSATVTVTPLVNSGEVQPQVGGRAGVRQRAYREVVHAALSDIPGCLQPEPAAGLQADARVPPRFR